MKRFYENVYFVGIIISVLAFMFSVFELIYVQDCINTGMLIHDSFPATEEMKWKLAFCSLLFGTAFIMFLINYMVADSKNRREEKHRQEHIKPKFNVKKEHINHN